MAVYYYAKKLRQGNVVVVPAAAVAATSSSAAADETTPCVITKVLLTDDVFYSLCVCVVKCLLRSCAFKIHTQSHDLLELVFFLFPFFPIVRISSSLPTDRKEVKRRPAVLSFV